MPLVDWEDLMKQCFLKIILLTFILYLSGKGIPSMINLDPAYGARSGGTIITLRGKHLNIQMKPRIWIGFQIIKDIIECKIDVQNRYILLHSRIDNNVSVWLARSVSNTQTLPN